jgi:hypothetical protein
MVYHKPLACVEGRLLSPGPTNLRIVLDFDQSANRVFSFELCPAALCAPTARTQRSGAVAPLASRGSLYHIISPGPAPRHPPSDIRDPARRLGPVSLSEIPGPTAVCQEQSENSTDHRSTVL